MEPHFFKENEHFFMEMEDIEKVIGKVEKDFELNPKHENSNFTLKVT